MGGSIRNIHDDLPLLRSVELVEVNALVWVHDQPPILDNQNFGWRNESCFRVVRCLRVWVDSVQHLVQFRSVSDINFPVDANGSGSVRHIDANETVLDVQFGHQILNFVGDVNQLFPLGRLNGNFTNEPHGASLLLAV